MNPEILLEKAIAATKPRRQWVNTDRWWPAIKALRTKGWSYGQIYDWLKEQGEPVQDNPKTFAAGASKKFRREMEKLSARIP